MKFPGYPLCRGSFYTAVFLIVFGICYFHVFNIEEHNKIHQNPIKEKVISYSADIVPFKQANNTSTKKVRSVDNQTERLDRIDYVCRNRKTHFRARHDIHYDVKTNLAYCYLPKCGCTYWKQVFILLSKIDKNGHIPDSALNITRYSVHIVSKFMSNLDSDFFKNKTNIMFVRDPYSRLWAAYLDKFFLSDFWISDAKFIIAKRKTKTICSHDVTFQEFIEHVISGDDTTANEHWRPMVKLCDPCVIRPQFVGKIESFSDDRDRFLQSVGQQKVLKYLRNQADHARSEILMLVTFYYHDYMSSQHWECISHSDFNQRIWTLFQLNGYIPSTISFNPIIPRNESEMKMHILSVLESAKLNKLALKQQKKQSMINAFKSLPKQYLEKLSQYYKADFEMFGYDPKPKEIFN